MVTFDSTLAGTSAATWAGDTRLDALPPFTLEGVQSLVVVASHPDDETLGAGGLIAECGRRGIRTLVVVVTDGAASHPNSTTTTARDLAARRADEVREAVGILSPLAAVLLLSHPDGGTLDVRDEIAADLRRAIPAIGASTLLVAPWRGDGHRDHRVVGEVCAEIAAARSLRFAEYPVWLWHWATPDHEDVPYGGLHRLALDAELLETKHRAIGAYDSQLRPLSDASGDEAMLDAGFVEHFTGSGEFFVAAAL